MIDLEKEDERKAYDLAVDHAQDSSGINFCLVMRDKETGELSVHRRQNQPCQGGEMRKYGKRSPNRANDYRPSDLHSPFPEGIPEAVSWYYPLISDRHLNFLLSDKSPYRKGFGSTSDVDVVRGKNEKMLGLVFRNTEVDPTVLVNFLQYMRSAHSFDSYINDGMTDQEAFILNMMFNMTLTDRPLANGETHLVMMPQTNTYYFPAVASVWRILNGEPHDLTGGTFRDGYDYNRPKIQDLFAARGKEKRVNFSKEIFKRGIVEEHIKEVETPWGKTTRRSYHLTDGMKGVKKFISEVIEEFGSSLE